MPYLEVGLTAVEAAKEITLSYFGRSLEEMGYATKLHDPRFEKDYQKSPVTFADQLAEKEIKEVIRLSFPDHGFIGEEEWVEDPTAERKRIIDAIDGTRNFARWLPYRATMLALSHHDEIVVAIVYTPLLGDLLRATKGGGCFHNGNPVHVSQRALSETYLGHSRYTYFEKFGFGKEIDILSQAVWYTRGIISREIGYVARGAMDLVVSIWSEYYDNAPFVLLVEEAGGKVTTLNGGVFGPADTSMIASNGVMHDEVVNMFST